MKAQHPIDALELAAVLEAWGDSTEQLHEQCPACGALVLVEPDPFGGDTALSHRHPVCRVWCEAWALVGSAPMVPELRTLPKG